MSGHSRSGSSRPMSSGVWGTETRRSNALSNRLNSVLSASYLGAGFRGTLELLDTRSVHNDAESRRQLRLNVQKEVIKHNGQIIDDFGQLAEQLKRIGTVIGRLNSTCNEMRQHIVMARQETRPAFEEASSLSDVKEEVQTKNQLLNAFQKRFVLPNEEVLSLTSASEPVDEHFFNVLFRAKRIHQDCEVLLGAENQRLGLEIMEQTSNCLSSGFQKLYRWTLSEFKQLNFEDPRIGGMIRKAFMVLAERPTLFDRCLDAFAELREHVLSDAFRRAMIVTASSGAITNVHPGPLSSAKPIESSAHDPLRYTGDILAWVHSAAVSENEALESLFIADGGELVKGIQAGIPHEPWAQLKGQSSRDFDREKTLKGLVNRDLNGVIHSLRQRLDLVVQGQDSPVTAYKVMNLLDFYEHTFTKLLGKESPLVETLAELSRLSFKHFENTLQETFTRLSNDSTALSVSPDLSVPDYLTEGLQTLASLMKAYDLSYGKDPTHPPGKENKFTPILKHALDPYFELIKRSEDTLPSKSDLEQTNRVIFRTNCLLAVTTTIRSYAFATATHMAITSAALSESRARLVEAQRAFLLRESGLQILLEALAASSGASLTEMKLASFTEAKLDLRIVPTIAAFQPDALVSKSQQLDAFLPSALVDATDNLKRVHSSSLVKKMTEEAVGAFVSDFEFVESVIIGADEACGINNETPETEKRDEAEDNFSLKALFPRSTAEIRVLLS
ncbi:Golgi transport complex subunit 6 [Ascosphaera atra]|nr:Golgi transport complex subunit 6 [Ascosphaera atra]